MEHPHAIERDIERAKSRLGTQLAQAEDKAREVMDWRTHYRRNPAPMLAAAAIGGFMLAMLGNDKTANGEGGARRALGGRATSLDGILDKMVDSLLAASSVNAAEYIEQWIPGFHGEFSRR